MNPNVKALNPIDRRITEGCTTYFENHFSTRYSQDFVALTGNACLMRNMLTMNSCLCVPAHRVQEHTVLC